MTIYTVHVPPARNRRAGRDDLRAVFIREGFSWPGLVVPLPWLLFRGMWITAAFYIIALAAAAMLGQQGELMPFAIAIGVFVPLLLGFEGNDLRRWSLGMRGYVFSGVVAASSVSEAEIRYFAGRADPETVPAALSPPPVPRPSLRQPLLPSPDIVGFFPSSGGAR